MAKQASKTVIGAFVISAIVMLIAGVIILGSGTLFKKTNKYVMFFEKSVKGLSVGSPVVWLGVEIGSVSNIILDADPEKLSVNVPVIIEVDPTRMRVRGEKARDLGQQLKRLIDRGLRAQMTQQSFVTGQMRIEVDFLPDTPVRLTGLEPGYPEIPTVPSSIDRFAKKFEDLPIDTIADNLLKLVGTIDTLLGDPELKNLFHNLKLASESVNRLVVDADHLVNNADNHLKTVSEKIQITVSEAQKTLKDVSRNIQAISGDAQELIGDADNQIKPVANKIQEAMVSVRLATDQAKNTLATVNGFVGERSDTRHKLNTSLDEIAGAARSLHSLMDYLERHPEALLKGKGGR